MIGICQEIFSVIFFKKEYTIDAVELKFFTLQLIQEPAGTECNHPLIPDKLPVYQI